jgi:hypothetical protein
MMIMLGSHCLIMLTAPLSLIMLTAHLLLFLNLHVYDDFFMFLLISAIVWMHMMIFMFLLI